MLFQAIQHFVKKADSPSALFSIKHTQQTPLLKQLSQHWSIAHKISAGYALSIGIAVLGTTIGLVTGDYYQGKAQQQQALTNQQQHLLSELENTVNLIRIHPQRLMGVLGESVWFDYEKTRFLGSMSQVKALLVEFESFTDQHATALAIDAQASKDLAKGYAVNIEAYRQLTEVLWQQLQPTDLTATEIAAAQQQLLASLRNPSSSKTNIELDRLTESLTRLKAAAEAQHEQAIAQMAQAEALRMQIVVGSMLLSVVMAVMLAVITSRAIVRPLQAVTRFAKAVVQESNFKLQSPISTQDEVGSLATSLNQLVQWVGEYTSALEQARHTMEKRVEERTQDLTEALQELRQTQSQLIQSEKMSSLGQLVAGIAHEVNNPINFIHGNLKHADEYSQNLLGLIQLYRQQDLQPTAAVQTYVEAIDLDFIEEDLPKLFASMQMGTERIRQIVLSLRNFSRLDEAEMKPVDIHEGIENTLLILNNRLKQGIHLIKEYGPLPLVECYPAQLNQVFMNLIANAIDALEEHQVTATAGSLDNAQASVSHAQPSAPSITIRTGQVDQHHVSIQISDNGPGISPNVQAKLFDPFFTTKSIGKGTGLGLSICYQIIEKHRGEIKVFSEIGQGTTFAILLPLQGG
ncbi:HAMP domain-containing protein [Phormidium sp. FACHB-592]|uniref:histidine kinase n=1 Tax=Stenomitos frigidus AS-A4 TaxID=2933935 RepID=A0ABV0KPY3_9CYAN|nr:ATP-binding protein [Phormidium sp. FACHB-592]MBD2075510.1 HAMP domain-containing protein [Phormidium sp. FACHB-592]